MSPSYPKRRQRPNNPTDNEEKTSTINEKTSDEAIPAEVFDFVYHESCADAWTLWLDHTHGACEHRPDCNEDLVRQGSRVDVQAERSDARWRRVYALRVLRPGRRWNPADQSGRGTGQQLHRTRRGHAGLIRKSAARRSRGDGPAHTHHAGCDDRSRTRTWRSSGRLLGSIVTAGRRAPVSARRIRKCVTRSS